MKLYVTTTKDLTNIADAIRSAYYINNLLLYPNDFISYLYSNSSTITMDAQNLIQNNISQIIGDTTIEKLNTGVFAGKSIKTIELLSCISIGERAFYFCPLLSNISFPSCEIIEAGAFCDCGMLINISFPACKFIGPEAFEGCVYLANISFPLCQSIGSYAFEQCGNLTSIYFPKCTIIEAGTFIENYNLSIASFPLCTTIETAVFESCYHLLSIYLLNSTMTTLADSAINIFSSTPITGYTESTDGVLGSIYVPASLVDTYKANTSWAGVSSRIVAYTPN